VQKQVSEVALFHDTFAIRGGGERVALLIAQAFQADLYYGFTREGGYDADALPLRAVSLNTFPLFQSSGVRPLVLSRLFKKERKKAAEYKVRIFSGSAAPFAAPQKTADSLNVLYCHTPPRYVFDKKEYFLSRIPYVAKPAARFAVDLFEQGYRDAVERMDVILANSCTVQTRIKEFLGRESTVIYPPVENLEQYECGGAEYYLSTARLSPLKRIDQIVSAFLTMPDKKLIIASGGEEEGYLRRLAGGASNIHFTGWVSDIEMRSLLADAIAVLYMPKDEDFGISPLEAMAAGKPVIGVDEGGLRETIVPRKTGFLLDPEFDIADICDAVKSLSPSIASLMSTSCRERAEQFRPQQFIDQMRSFVDASLAYKLR